MRIAYLDCFSGISGDMFLGALVDAGVSPKLLEEAVAALDGGARLEISRVVRGGISATKANMYSHGEKDLPREVFWEQHGHGHSHGHGQGHEHHEPVWGRVSDPARTGQRPVPTHSEHEHGRGLKEIRQIIEKASISGTAKATAIRIFEVLGAAEAEVHNTSIESVHFHEVGAVDAMVDIVCAAVGSEALGVDEWICSPLNVGGGTVKCAHGTFPIPAPATLDLLKHAPIYSGEIQKELVTPTGAAIVHVLASRFGQFPAMRTNKTGYGAGSRDFKGFPNVLRITVGETADESAATAPTDTVTILEANLDDMTPQVFGYVMERALNEGALDVYGTAVQMKKNRPGTLLTVLCRPEDEPRLTKLIFAETTTLGIRSRTEKRATLNRRYVMVNTKWGAIRMKL